MANYRPKSLTELNNLYDKSMAAQNAIKKKGSAIAGTDSNENKDSATSFQDELTLREKTPAQKASDELSDALNDFMKSFGEPEQTPAEKPTVRQPLPITKTVKSAASPRPKADKKAEHPVSKVSAPEEPKAKKEKPDLMRNSERSELLDDYMKIMNDEDDDVAYLKNIIKKKKKNKKEKHQGSPLFEEENKEDLTGESTTDEEAPLPEEVQTEAEAISQVSASSDEEAQDEFTSFASGEEAEEYEDEQQADETAKPKKKRKNIFLQLLLMIVLLAVLLAAVGVGLMKVVVGVDSGNAFAGKYYVFTADETYEEVKINEGDLVITEDKAFGEDDAFAYTDSSSKITFALKGTQIDDERFMAHNDGEVELIRSSNVKGTVIRILPQVGTFVQVVMDNFIIVISVLVAVALILILVLALAFRTKSSYDIDDSEELEEADESDESDESEETDEDENYEADEYDYPAEEDSLSGGELFSSID
ncbi:MAG: hypothetical protein IJ491_03375 [Clostridia bacterium]|nr:hypothetical protein [Clostridia bacterium]